MPKWMLVLMVCAAGVAVANPPAAPPAAPSSTPVPVEADWQARALAWFGDAKDDAAKRKAMRQATKALKQPCRYCHTPDFKAYTDKQSISRQMMALSTEHGVTCAECHAGKAALTELGQKAKPMWALAHERKVFCEHCHTPGSRFGTLTPAGKTYAAELKKAP